MRSRRVLLLTVVALGLTVPAAWATTGQPRPRARRSNEGNSTAPINELTPIPPIGLPINTISGVDGNVQIGDKSYGTGALRLVVVNRDSLDAQTFSFADNPSGFEALKSKANEFNEHWLDIVTAPDGLKVSAQEAKSFNETVVSAIGGAPLDEHLLEAKAPLSVLGVLGWSPGTAYENVGRLQDAASRSGALVGYLQRNPASHAAGFAFGDYPSFSTRSEGDSATIDVAGQKYDFTSDGASGFAVLVLNRADLTLAARKFFATRDEDVDVEERAQKDMGAFLKKNRDSSHLIFVQSISDSFFGSPYPTTTGWNELAEGIADVGGTPDVINNLNRKSAYALVTEPGVSGEAVESVKDPATHQDGNVTGVLARDHTDGFAPLFADPTGQPTLNDLLQLSYRRTSPWPDRDTAGQRAAISYIAQQLGLPVDDPRLEYTNLTVHFGEDQYSGKLERMAYPGGSVPFSAHDFTTVKSELLKEFLWVSKVRAYTDEIRHVMDESIVIKQGVLSSIANRIKNKSGAGDKEAKVNAFQIYEQLFALAKNFAPDPESKAITVAVATAFKVAGALTKANGTNVLGNFTTSTNDLADDLVLRYDEGLASLGLMRSILVSDHDKLETAGTNIIDDKPGWVWNDTTTASTLRDMTLAAKRLINQTLLPTVYATYHLPLNFQDPSNCRVFKGEPGGAWLSHVIRFAGSPGDLHADRQAWAVGKQEGGDVYGGFNASAELFDPLFREVSPDSTDRLGLSKPVFLTRVMGQADLSESFCQPH